MQYNFCFTIKRYYFMSVMAQMRGDGPNTEILSYLTGIYSAEGICLRGFRGRATHNKLGGRRMMLN